MLKLFVKVFSLGLAVHKMSLKDFFFIIAMAAIFVH